MTAAKLPKTTGSVVFAKASVNDAVIITSALSSSSSHSKTNLPRHLGDDVVGEGSVPCPSLMGFERQTFQIFLRQYGPREGLAAPVPASV